MFLKLPQAEFSIQTKQLEVSNILSQQKAFNVIGTLEIKDITTGFSSVTRFDSEQQNRTGYWTSWVKGSDKVNETTGLLDNRRDLLKIDIIDPQKQIVAQGQGSYLEQVTFSKDDH